MRHGSVRQVGHGSEKIKSFSICIKIHTIYMYTFMASAVSTRWACFWVFGVQRTMKKRDNAAWVSEHTLQNWAGRVVWVFR